MKKKIFFILTFFMCNTILSISKANERYSLKPNPFKKSYSDCINCHTKKETDTITRSKALFRAHGNISSKHGSKIMSCNFCHDKSNHNYLTNGLGEKISFEVPSMVCQTCHFEVVRDWNNGHHGKRVGGWNKPSLQTQCIDCHKAHDVYFKAMKAYAPPRKSKFLIPKK